MASRRRGALRLGVTLALLAMTACGGAAPAGRGASITPPSTYHAKAGVTGGKVIYGEWQAVNNLDPLTNTFEATAHAQVALWQTLWTFAPDHSPIPEVVSKVPTQANGMVAVPDSAHMNVTVDLLPGLRWSDGSPLTTADVEFTWKAICDPRTGALNTVGWDHIASMEIDSPTRMIWHFGPNRKGTCGLGQDLASGVYAPYLGMQMYVMPKAVLQSVSHADWGRAPYFTRLPTVVSGPYQARSFVPGPAAQLVMTPNPHFLDGREHAPYFNHKPYLDQLVYQVYGDKASELNALRAGEASIGLDLTPTDLGAARAVPDARAVATYPIQNEFVLLNVGGNTKGCQGHQWAQSCGKPTVFNDDPVLRQALNLAVDKDGMRKQLTGGLGKPMVSFVPPTLSPWYDSSLPPFKRDVAKANRMLDGDGWKRGADGVRVKNGRRLEFSLTTTTGNPQRAAMEEQMASNWKELGARVSIANYQSTELFGAFNNGGIITGAQFDAALFSTSWPPDPSSWAVRALETYIPTAANPVEGNDGHWKDAKLAELFERGASTVDPAQRKSIYDQAQREIGNLAPGSTGAGGDAWNVADWYLAKS